MARSLVVKHEEKLGTSPLLTAFLVLAAVWMISGVFFASAASGSQRPAAAPAAAP